MTICKRCIVKGKVQGVFYRVSTQQQARDQGVTGHAKNCHDGSVEVLMCGHPDAVTALTEWLWKGSQLSDVSSVECDLVSYFSSNDFLIF